MNTYKILRNYKLKFILIIACVCFAAAFFLAGLFISRPKTVTAQNLSLNSFSYLSSEKENQEIPSPQDILVSESVTAIVSGTDKLFIHTEETGFFTIDFSDYFSSPNVSQIKAFNEDTLLIFNFGTIEKVKYKESPAVVEDLKDSSGRVISGTNYDINDGYLAVIFGEADNGSCKIYRINGGTITETASFSGVNGKKPVCINSANEIFYVSTEQKLCKRDVSDISYYEVLGDVSPDKMIAKEDFLYFISSGKIYGFDLSNYLLLDTEEIIEERFDLGNLPSPSGLCFNGENVVIADAAIPAVQEFSVKVNGENLVLSFTGTAIAKDKTAYNRIAKNGTVQTTNGRVAVLDDYKLTIVKVDFNDKYKKDNFINIINGSEDVSGYTFDGFILGEKSVLLINSSLNTVKEYDFENGTGDTLYFSDKILEGQSVNGTFYVLSGGTDGLRVYQVKNGTSLLVFEKSDMQYGANEHMCIDARRNIYLTDTEENAVFIFKKENGYAYGEKIENSVAENVLSLSVDFGGGLFALEPEGIAYYSNGNRYEISLCFNGLDLSDVSSFSLSFSDKSAFITLTGDELLRYSLSLPNMSVSDIEIPADFAINGYTAEQENLTIFETVNDAELFGIATVNPEDNIFEYTGFNALPDKQFVKVCALTLKETYETDERTLSLFVVSDGKLYIAFTEYLFNVTETCVTEPEYVKGYVATNVNAYYLPVITDGAEYALRTGNAILRLDKKTEILPVKNINFEGKDYLYSKILTESGEVYGYIPKTFTVEVLSEHANGEEFVLRKVTKTTLYKDAEMTEKIIDIENVTVRVYTAHSTDKTSYISVDTENGILFGYVETSAVKAQESYSIRNAVIIVAVSLSVFITSLFFILKKYKG